MRARLCWVVVVFVIVVIHAWRAFSGHTLRASLASTYGTCPVTGFHVPAAAATHCPLRKGGSAGDRRFGWFLYCGEEESPWMDYACKCARDPIARWFCDERFEGHVCMCWVCVMGVCDVYGWAQECEASAGWATANRARRDRTTRTCEFDTTLREQTERILKVGPVCHTIIDPILNAIR